MKKIRRIKEAIAAIVITGILSVGVYASVCTLIDNDWTFHNGFPNHEVYADEKEQIDYPDEISAMPCIHVVNEIVQIKEENVQIPVKNARITDESAQETEENVQISLGIFRLTAYCSCSKCCGKWAENRPVDENGNEIVYGAAGQRLTAGRSIAVDPELIPYGTELIINGKVYEAMDCGSGIDGLCIDIYFDNHQEALNFGIQYAEVFSTNNYE